ncbi:MAG: hypothetical protein D6805_05155 [Planctomycetota bacterium]|nr:MAG: hypothetical protein D6805_05155 [Planctomycetota bacterium]
MLGVFLFCFGFVYAQTKNEAEGKLKKLERNLKLLQLKLKNVTEKLRETEKEVERLNETILRQQDEIDNSREAQESSEDEFNSFLNQFKKMIHFNGFAAVEFHDAFSEDSTLKNLSSYEKSASKFNVTDMSLISTITPSEWLRFYTEVIYQPKQVVDIDNIWLEYLPTSYLRIRVGRFLTYFGLWNRIHTKKNLIPTIDSNNIGFIQENVFAKRTLGLEVEYSKNMGETGSFQFLFWLGNGKRRNSSDPDAVPLTVNELDLLDFDENKEIGTRLAFEFEDLNLTQDIVIKQLRFGVSGYFCKVPQNTTNPSVALFAKVDNIFLKEGGRPTNYDPSNLTYLFNGEPNAGYTDRALNFHFQMRMLKFTLQAEYVLNFVDPHGKGVKNFLQSGFYVFFSYEFILAKWLGKDWQRFGRFIPFFLYDNYQANDHMTGELGTRERFVYGLNWKISQYFLLKFEYQQNLYPRGNFRNFDRIATQAVFSF